MYAHKDVHGVGGRVGGGEDPGRKMHKMFVHWTFFILNSKKKKGDKYVYGSMYIHTYCVCVCKSNRKGINQSLTFGLVRYCTST